MRIWRRRRLIDLIDIGNSMGCDVAAGSKNRNFPWQWFCKFSSIYYWRKKVPIITWAPAVSELLFLLYYSPFILCLFSWKKKIYFLSFPFVFSSSPSMCWAKSSSSRIIYQVVRRRDPRRETDPARDSRWWLLLLLPPLVNVWGPLLLLLEKEKKK